MTSKSMVIEFLHQASEIMVENKDYLISIDSIVGDADLGLTMSDGFTAAYDAVKDSDQEDLGKLLYAAGKAMSIKVPSTMGTLMASGLMQAARALRGKTEFSDDDWVSLFEAYEQGVQKLGKAKIGEKTFLDGFDPGVKALKDAVAAGKSLKEAAATAAVAAENGFKSTVGMLAIHGRAAIRGEESRKLEDPGAKVASLIFQAFDKAM
ncbi:dihydroxyacetone kinase subunit L [Bifidobacterium sp. ESL0704]|uniref:dihydroxyacetone kinase family protein n=1 Tax=Bifidobacterium sp. ESL0704 TaxID=2983219 RepID=UPI0023F85D9B|nr:dihydroxyacetone kinase subunit L [Bifidobacterium sp. ESL0704]WEV53450.1 dihydroxyacetone kinase subunit L [Bifidobacterium sp. ESL0704]